VCGGPARARARAQNIPHHLGHQRKKTSSIRQLEVRSADYPEIRFMNEPGGIERRVGRAIAQPGVCQLAQPIIDQRHELIAGVLVSGAPALQQPCDVVRGKCSHVTCDHA
jgi:hypothetical protein